MTVITLAFLMVVVWVAAFATFLVLPGLGFLVFIFGTVAAVVLISDRAEHDREVEERRERLKQAVRRAR